MMTAMRRLSATVFESMNPQSPGANINLCDLKFPGDTWSIRSESAVHMC